MEENKQYHIPAMLDECMQALNIRPAGVYADVTFGGGGHSRAIMQHLGPEGLLYGMDQDPDAMTNTLADERFTFIRGNFRYIRNFICYCGHEKVDGILADLGVSFHHFDTAERGFSFRADAPLDMRMNPQDGQTAADILATYTDEQLTDLLRLYTDLRQPGRIAHLLVQRREQKPMRTTGELAAFAQDVFGQKQLKKEAAQLFQALRMEVNQETAALEEFLTNAEELIRPGGRLVILTYHSVEDRMVKNFLRVGNIRGIAQQDIYGSVRSPWKLIVKGDRPCNEEVERNPRARSARLRAAEKI